MTVTADVVNQYYTAIFRQAPTSAVSLGYQASANNNAALQSMLSAANAQVDPIIRLYQAAFNRLPDPAGLTGWVTALTSGQTTLEKISQGFANSAESQVIYPASMSNAQFVGQLYFNILQRPGEEAGINGWLNAMANGATRAQVMLGFANSVEFATRIEPNVNAFLTAIANTPVANQNQASLYTGTLFDKGGVVPGDSFALTTNIDSVAGNAGLTVTGVDNGAGPAGGQTFNSGDTVGQAKQVDVTFTGNGNVAADINNAVFNGKMLASATVNAALWDGVTAVNNSGGGLAQTLTVANGDIASVYGIVGDTSAAGISVGIRATQAAGTADTAKFLVAGAGSLIAPVGQAATLNSAALTSTSAGIEKITVATSGSNWFTVTGSTANGTDGNTLEITGSGSNTIDARPMTQVSLYDMSTSTGTNTLRVDNTLTSSDTVKGGTGADTLRAAPSGGNVVANLTVTGVETLRLGSGANTGTLLFAAAPNFTTVRVDGDNAENGTYTVGSVGAFANLLYRGDALLANTAVQQQFNNLTVTNSFTGTADTVAVTIDNGGVSNSSGYGANTLTANGVETVNVTLSDVTAAAASTYNITSNTLDSVAFSGLGTITTTLNAAPLVANTDGISSVNLSGMTSTGVQSRVNLAADSVNTNTAITASKGGTLVVLAGAENAGDTLVFTGDAGNDVVNGTAAGTASQAFAGTMVVTLAGGGTDIVNAGAGTTSVTSNVAGSNNTVVALAGAVTFTTTGVGSTNAVITTAGSNANVSAAGSTAAITFTGNTGADTMIGGSGNDVLTGAAAIDVLTGGLGADRFVMNQTNTANRDTITDFTVAQGDNFAFSAGAYAGSAAAGTALTVATAAAAAAAAANTIVVVDTAANIAANLNAASAIRFAYDTTNNNLIFDADGDFTGGSVVIANVTLTGVLTATNFAMVV